MRGHSPEPWTLPRVAEWLALVGIIGVAAFLRVRRMSLLDIFEDGYHHWWIGGYWAETGLYLDPFSKMTQGNWLPGYYPIVSAFYSVSGREAMIALRSVSLIASLTTIFFIYLVARKHGTISALSAAFFQGLVIEDALIGSMATPESLVALLFVVVVYLLWHCELGTERTRSTLAATLLLVASTLRYEVWVAAVLIPIYGWLFARPRFPSLLLVSLPSLAFMALWTAALSPSGFLPQIVFGQTAREAGNEISLGVIADTPYGRLWGFWVKDYAAGLFPLYFLGPAYMIVRLRREFTTILALVLFAAVSVIVATGLGTGSYRYLVIVVPFLSLAAGRAVGRLISRLAQRWPRPGMTAVGAVLALLVVACVANTIWITPSLDGLGTLHAPLARAGIWISDQPWPEGRNLLSDSPVATYYSKVDPAHAWSSFWLPDNRTEALLVLKASYAYVLFVNVTYYPLTKLFPELETGSSTTDFLLVYDPNSWELQYGAKQVFVYQVIQ